MKAEDFRRIALSLPETAESAHLNHPDFRVRGKIFATLYPDDQHGVVLLTPKQQAELVRSTPDAFVPARGAWGRRGCTQVVLEAVKVSALKTAMRLAWCNKAPKKLVEAGT